MRSSLFLLLLLASPARAFHDSSQFFVPTGIDHAATLGASAEGVYFTGAPRFASLDCGTCHTSAPHEVALRIGADDDSLFDVGYEPGHTYVLEVALEHEDEGLEHATKTCTEVPPPTSQLHYVQCNNNNFALEIDAGDEALSEGFCASAPSDGVCPKPDRAVEDVLVAPGGDAVFGSDPHDATMPYERLRNDATSWYLWWTAPASRTGPLTIYVGAVDGNGGHGTVAIDQDPDGDDTARAAIRIAEKGYTPSLVELGCSMSPRGPSPLGVMLVLLLAWRSRRARVGAIRTP